MSALLEREPYGPRRDGDFLAVMNALTEAHLHSCPPLRRIWKDWKPATSVEELPFLHAGLFKTLELRSETAGMRYGRTLESSSTGGARPSRIPLDSESSQLQSRSVASILRDFIGGGKRPLLIVDSAQSLRTSGAISARTAAALSLRPITSDIFFLLGSAADPANILWNVIDRALGAAGEVMVYGFTSALWQAWRHVAGSADFRERLAGTRMVFLHSGGWKKMEALAVTRAQFNHDLLAGAGAGSRVIDFYGLVEQVGIVYPLCEYGSRHVPVWADVLVRDPFTLKALSGETGQLALMNCLSHGAPCHSVLTEDLGRIVPGECECGRSGKRFELLGRIPKAEVRGCANV